jgi:hypothetical protein
MRVRHKGRSAVLAIVALLAAIPGTAMASTSAAAPKPPRHCSFFSSTGVTKCYGSYAEATRQSQSRTAAGDVIQATLFDDENFGGSSFTVYGSDLCEKDGVVNFQINLPDGWKDVVSSVQPWGNCWIWLYPEPDLGGDRDGPFKENTTYVGDFMDDRTESVGLS